MSTRKTILLMAGIAFIAPRTINRLVWGKQAPSDLYEPGMAAWYGTVLDEIAEFGR
jgi:hypothetical protein